MHRNRPGFYGQFGPPFNWFYVTCLIPHCKLTKSPQLDSTPASRKYTFTIVGGPCRGVRPPNDHTVFLKPSDLSRVGLISGDWVSHYQKTCIMDLLFRRPSSVRQTHKLDDWSKWPPVRTHSPNGASRRPSRVWTMCDLCRGEVVGDPALLYNLGTTPFGSDARSVLITASSFGPLPPPLPTARSVTVAQITSPQCSNSPYGPSLLSGLQKYFRASLRLVKRGDVLIVPVEIDPLTIHVATALSHILHASDDNL